MGLTFDCAAEFITIFDDVICEGGLGDLCHMPRAFLNAAKFAAIAHRPPHHVGKNGHDFIILGTQIGDASHHKLCTLLDRARTPCLLRQRGILNRFFRLREWQGVARSVN